MTKITIQRIVAKPTRNDGIRLGIYDGTQWFNYFPKKGYDWKAIQDYLREGIIIDADVFTNNYGFQIKSFVGENNFAQGGMPPPQNSIQPRTQEPIEKIEVSEKVKNEIITDTEEIFKEINVIIQSLERDSGTLSEEVLSIYELKISAFNVRLAQSIQQADKKWKDIELDYKRNVLLETEQILLSNTEGMTKTKAKELAENKFQDKKADLTIWQNKKEGYENVYNGIANLVFAIKERIKIKLRV